MALVDRELDFKAEYAKSGRAGCKGCRDTIDKDSLRLAIMVQSAHFDGKIPNWYHFDCFWTRGRVTDVSDISGFDSLRWEDQEKIKKKIESSGGSKSSEGIAMEGKYYQDYSVEYSKSGGAKCKVCEEKIKKNELRLGVKQFDNARAKMYGPYFAWHHVDCFVSEREEIKFDSAMETNKLNGFNKITAEDRELLISKLGKGSKKRKIKEETVNFSGSSKVDKLIKTSEEKALKEQSRDLWKIKDNLKQATKAALSLLLEVNKQQVPPGESAIIERLSDCMLFGALERCPQCGSGQLVYSTSAQAYRCMGHMSEWTKCQFATQMPKRRKFIVPKQFHDVPFFKKYKYVAGRERVFPSRPNSAESSPVKKAKTTSETSTSNVVSTSSSIVTSSQQPMRGMFFALPAGEKYRFSTPTYTKNSVIKQLSEYGARIVTNVDPRTMALLLNKDEIENKPSNGAIKKQIKDARLSKIHVVNGAGLLSALQKLKSNNKGGVTQKDIFSLMEKESLTEGADPPQGRIQEIREGFLMMKSGGGGSNSSKSYSSSSDFMKSMTKSQKLKLKGGSAVFPESEMEDEAHVYTAGKSIYSATLGMVDAIRGTNSYYKLQMLEADPPMRRWWVFRAWGRIGTTIGGTKLEPFASATLAKTNFEGLYEEKTGTEWDNRAHADKVPGKFFPLEIDYGGDNMDEIKPLANPGQGSSKLAMPIQRLICRLFDVERMKNAMLEFDLDLEKMPLGKLSKRQILQAYELLNNLEPLLKPCIGTGGSVEKTDPSITGQVLDKTNQFFTLIPHDFGLEKPPLLDTLEAIKAKCEMLDNLLEIEIAYNLLRQDSVSEATDDPIDGHYSSLKAKMSVLEKSSHTYTEICDYVKKTHGKTHSMYTLEVKDILSVERHGEISRYRPFKSLHNRMLLWHGTRITNCAGILSQGLRIAPPEAPVTGYMFGKGIYFADMVSKSANYCFPSRTNNFGYLILCEVALGNMQELTDAEMIVKPKKGKHSVKGVGSTTPDPKEWKALEDGVIVPSGVGIKNEVFPDGKDHSSLLYNEYIVYDVAQVNIKYLVEVDFDYKY